MNIPKILRVLSILCAIAAIVVALWSLFTSRFVHTNPYLELLVGTMLITGGLGRYMEKQMDGLFGLVAGIFVGIVAIFVMATSHS